MARRAGKVSSGESQVEAFLKKQKGYLAIIAEDSPHAQSKFSQWAKDVNIPVLIEGTKEELGLAIGMSPRAIILIMDRGFAEAIEIYKELKGYIFILVFWG
jgi:ribosomal protein L7Ae-like RNA K-turn-binding protein